MKKMKKKLGGLFFLWGVFLMALLPVCPAKAAIPSVFDNLDVGLRSTSKLVALDSGYMRVFYNGKAVCIEHYDSGFALQSKRSVAMELPLWGGFYAGSDAYYLVEGQNNTEENDAAEVIRVIKYDALWNRLGAAVITGSPAFGGQVRYPFDYGCVEMAENNGTLYVVTGHEGYVDPQYNQGHQGFLMIAVDEASMTGKIVDCDLWHSFAQYISSKDSDLYVLEQSEGSRYTKLTKYNAADLTSTSIPVLEYGGSRDSAWAISCFATVDGMALSADHVLCLGTSIDQSQYEHYSYDMPYNIYLTVTPMSNFSQEATTVKWLTDYSGGEKEFKGAKITKINDDRFMVSWEESGTEDEANSMDDSLSASTLHYVFVDGKGDKIGQEFTQRMPLSDCQPIVKGSKIVYYASNANMVNFYSIDTQTGSVDKKAYRVAGEDATWSIENGTLVISGSGAVSFGTDTDNESYSERDVWGAVRNLVKKIVIRKGITSISDNAFARLGKLEEIEIEPGLQSIGKQAFYGCDMLKKIIIPSSVTSIGEDFLWTGAYWVPDKSHVVYATIYADHDSYAIKYARENGISFKMSLSGAKVTGLKENYEYTGKALKPEVTVKLGDQVLEEDEDYTVEYSDNKKPGTAKVEITGIGHYFDNITKTFEIVAAEDMPPGEQPANGAAVRDERSGAYYKVTKKSASAKATAVYVKPTKKVRNITVPATVKIGGVTCKVTSISAKAFANNTKLQSVTIGKNVSSIGKQAFFNCRKLKKITIKTTALTSAKVGAKAFKGIYSKAVIKVPAKKLSAYKKLLKTKGAGAKVKVKK